MKKYWLMAGLIVMLTGCANFLTTTATSGTGFGMRKEAVLKVIEKKRYKIVSQDENTIVVEGMQEQLKQPAIKTFAFENDRLISVSDRVLDGSVKGSTFTFMR
jgi:hypothetical protein